MNCWDCLSLFECVKWYLEMQNKIIKLLFFFCFCCLFLWNFNTIPQINLTFFFLSLITAYRFFFVSWTCKLCLERERKWCTQHKTKMFVLGLVVWWVRNRKKMKKERKKPRIVWFVTGREKQVKELLRRRRIVVEVDCPRHWNNERAYRKRPDTVLFVTSSP